MSIRGLAPRQSIRSTSSSMESDKRPVFFFDIDNCVSTIPRCSWKLELNTQLDSYILGVSLWKSSPKEGCI
jgi:hypothetical protein